MKKILIAVPCMDMVSARFAQSLASLRRTEHCIVEFQLSSLIYDSRNRLCEAAIKCDADYMLWLDSDMMFDPDILERLIADNVDIVSGLYFRRSYPFTPVLFSKLERNGDDIVFEDVKTYPENQLFEVAGCGFGCVLMKTDVLFDIAGKNGAGVWFTPLKSAGEDCAFCIRAREQGYKIYCDTSVQLGHVGHSVITEATYKAISGQERK